MLKIGDIKKFRKPENKVDDLFIQRWSPRAFSSEEIKDEDLMSLFEAAKWAPSSYNNQHWRFIYAKRNTKYWAKFMNLMIEFNQSWAKNASVLVVIVSKKTFDHNNEQSITHSFDTGAAWMSLALQATIKGYITHGMQGFDYDKARKELGVPEEYNVEAMIAIGKQGKKEDLPKEMQEKEAPSDRKKIADIVMEGKFKS